MTNIFIPLAIAAAAAMAMASLSGKTSTQHPVQAATASADVISPDPAHLATYRKCAREAEVRLLSANEAADCVGSYLRLKLSFLPDADIETYRQLEPAAKSAINLRAYLAYSKWRSSAEPGAYCCKLALAAE